MSLRPPVPPQGSSGPTSGIPPLSQRTSAAPLRVMRPARAKGKGEGGGADARKWPHVDVRPQWHVGDKVEAWLDDG